ncbi:response regulator transcription factor [Geomonas subterranea]|uniref:Response regulator n=1 Tax=Geomonas subterranea TaxID=2847989 RepID=A0ABX8LKE6_9BACT|nr:MULTISPECIES: response regulator [Geomonas]QXE92478.1 response regulator [Geomonas subterranea]QXM09423.1 response regulator [Geomonas subterranea]
MATTMMLVEDDCDTLEILSVVLRRKYGDLLLCTADNGRKGVELFKERAVDIVITDVNMPEMGGVAMVRAIREMKPQVQFIFITADTGRATVEHAVGGGFQLDHYIEKPIDYRHLFSAIDESLAAVRTQPPDAPARN